ncbi:protein vestigial-like [Oxyura jamaicensis]|nr:protein vestigial-like [Oxyura jamaicensis]
MPMPSGSCGSAPGTHNSGAGTNLAAPAHFQAPNAGSAEGGGGGGDPRHCAGGSAPCAPGGGAGPPLGTRHRHRHQHRHRHRHQYRHRHRHRYPHRHQDQDPRRYRHQHQNQSCHQHQHRHQYPPSPPVSTRQHQYQHRRRILHGPARAGVTSPACSRGRGDRDSPSAPEPLRGGQRLEPGGDPSHSPHPRTSPGSRRPGSRAAPRAPRRRSRARLEGTRASMTEVEPVLDFASSGRTGRRNALPDILGSPAGVSPSDLPLKLAEMSLSAGSSQEMQSPSTEVPPPQPQSPELKDTS